MASSWDDFLPKLILTLVDKAVLGGAFALATYLLQQRLEVFKRNQAHASELAKARIAAYNRVFAAVSALDHANDRMWLAIKRRHKAKTVPEVKEAETAGSKQAEEYTERNLSRVTLIDSDSYLLGVDFTRAAREFVKEFDSTVQIALKAATGAKVLDPAEYANRAEKRTLLRKALTLCLPPFAREPANDLHFSAPRFDDVYAELVADQARIEEAVVE